MQNGWRYRAYESVIPLRNSIFSRYASPMTATPKRSLPRRQRGVVLLVAMIAMLLLSLAGIALVRSVDTDVGVAGNLGFRQTSMGPVNQAIEIAVLDVFKSGDAGDHHRRRSRAQLLSRRSSPANREAGCRPCCRATTPR